MQRRSLQGQSVAAQVTIQKATASASAAPLHPRRLQLSMFTVWMRQCNETDINTASVAAAHLECVVSGHAWE